MNNFLSLWPLPVPEVVVVTGAPGAGKTTFAQTTGAVPQRTVIVDFEKSAVADAQMLPFKYLDVQAELSRLHPNGYGLLQLYSFVVSYLDNLPPGEQDVIVLDNASPLEDAIAAYVEAHPEPFGFSPKQFQLMSGLKWGAVKNLYAQLLTRWVSKAKMIFVIVHLRDKFINNVPVKDPITQQIMQEPKGKDTLEQLASLFLWLEPGLGGVPAARVLKSRIAKKVWKDTPNPHLEVIPVLPERLPVCTWAAIRDYMRNPADRLNPKPEERVSQRELSDDERLILKARLAETELARLQTVQQLTETPPPTLVEPRKAEDGDGKVAAARIRDSAAFLEMGRELATQFGHYQYGNTGKPDFEHIRRTIAKIGFVEVTRDNASEVKQKLFEYAAANHPNK